MDDFAGPFGVICLIIGLILCWFSGMFVVSAFVSTVVCIAAAGLMGEFSDGDEVAGIAGAIFLVVSLCFLLANVL